MCYFRIADPACRSHGWRLGRGVRWVHDGRVALCGDGLAVGTDLVAAAESATRQALEPLGGLRPDLVFVFVCSTEPDEVSAALERAAKLSAGRTALGCNAAGVIGQGRGVELTSAVSVWAAVLPGARLRSFHLEVLTGADSVAVLGLPPAEPSASAAILLADPYSFPIGEFVDQVSDAVPALSVSGGLANGLRGAGSTRLLVDDRVHERGAVGVLLGPGVAARTLVSQGCRAIGPPMTVTAAEGNALLGLAGSPALGKLADIVRRLPPGDQALVTAGLHVGIAMDEYADDHDQSSFLVRGVVGTDPDRGGLIVGAPVTVGQTVRFQVRDADAAAADLVGSIKRFRTGLLPAERAWPNVSGALLFSCAGRGTNLFADAHHDVLAVQEGLGTSPVAGFFAAGEIGPVGGRTRLHGSTASVLAFG
jgi:small ligand-binding sensory domain FIST